jgi:hypothetical protein
MVQKTKVKVKQYVRDVPSKYRHHKKPRPKNY